MPKVWWTVLLLGCGLAEAQAPVKTGSLPVRAALTVPSGTSVALQAMQARAAVVFAGHVVKVDRQAEAGFVDVTFRVDEAVRGCNKLGTYVLREWAGLWAGGAARYVVGQRLLMLLTGRGPGGMSAPVDGLDGAIPILANAVEPIADGKGVAPAEDGSSATEVTGMTADLRWVAAHALRSLAYVATSLAAAGGGQADWVGPIAPMASAASRMDLQPSVGAVLAVLRAGSASTVSTAGGSGHEEQ